jgi:lipopolysaccharide heptosyltransferase I
MMAHAKILVIRLSALGDVLFTLPAVHALKLAHPDAEIDWLVEERAAALLDLYSGLRRVVVWERSALARDGRRPRRWPQAAKALARHLGALRRERYDLVLDFHGTWKSGVHAWLSRGARKVGFHRTHRREGSDLFVHETVQPPDGALHRIDRALALARAVDPSLPTEAPRPPLTIPPSSRAFAAGVRGELGLDGAPYAVLHPGTSKFGSIKRWRPDRFSHLADLLHERLGLRVLVTWGPGEEELARSVVSGMKQPGGAATPRLGTLTDLAALLAGARAVVASDSAALHLAAFLGVPVVGLYGPKDPEIYGPRFAPSRVVHVWLPCSPCVRRTCPDVLCMEEIGVGQVFEAAARLLTTSAGV